MVQNGSQEAVSGPCIVRYTFECKRIILCTLLCKIGIQKIGEKRVLELEECTYKNEMFIQSCVNDSYNLL